MKKLIGLGLIVVCLWSACKPGSGDKKNLPIYGKREPVTKTVNGKSVVDTLYQTIAAFKTINQYGDSINNKSLDGTIYIADFFFTTCPSICPIMHRNMLSVYNTFMGARRHSRSYLILSTQSMTVCLFWKKICR